MNRCTMNRTIKGEREVLSELSLFWKKGCFCLFLILGLGFFSLPTLLVVVQMKLFTLLLTCCITEDRLGGQTGLLFFFFIVNFFLCLHCGFCLCVHFHANYSFRFFLCVEQEQVPEWSPRILRDSLPVL